MIRLFKAAAIALTLAVSTSAMPVGAAPPTRPANQPGLIPVGSNLYLVYSNAVAGTDAKFNTWYDGHMQQVMKLPGFVRAQRFKAHSLKAYPAAPFAYLVIYEINGDPDTVIAELGPAVKEGRLVAPDPRYVVKTDSSVYNAIIPGFAGQK